MPDFNDPKQLDEFLQGIGYDYNRHPSQQDPDIVNALRGVTFNQEPLIKGFAPRIRPEQPSPINLTGSAGITHRTVPAAGPDFVDLTTGTPEEVAAKSRLGLFGREPGTGSIGDLAFTVDKYQPITAPAGGGGLQAVEAAGGAPQAGLDPGSLNLPSMADRAALDPGSLDFPSLDERQPFAALPEAPAAPKAPGGDVRFQHGRGFYEMSIGLGQMQAGAKSLSPQETAGGSLTFLGGLMDMVVTPENKDTIWGRMGPALAIIGTALNIQGQRESSRIQRDYQVDLQETIGEVLVGLDGL